MGQVVKALLVGCSPLVTAAAMVVVVVTWTVLYTKLLRVAVLVVTLETAVTVQMAQAMVRREVAAAAVVVVMGIVHQAMLLVLAAEVLV
tara:strand:- start:313 stop:579 length:267 start_codon:yes stop_codon:yes gene_type:complete